MKFKVHEIVLMNSEDYPEVNGTEVTIERCKQGRSHPSHDKSPAYVIVEDVVGDGKRSWMETALKKLPPKDDLTSWDTCVFKPTEVTA